MKVELTGSTIGLSVEGGEGKEETKNYSSMSVGFMVEPLTGLRGKIKGLTWGVRLVMSVRNLGGPMWKKQDVRGKTEMWTPLARGEWLRPRVGKRALRKGRRARKWTRILIQEDKTAKGVRVATKKAREKP